MKRRAWLFWVLAAIAAGTVASGLVQLAAPGFVLGLVPNDEVAALQAAADVFVLSSGPRTPPRPRTSSQSSGCSWRSSAPR